MGACVMGAWHRVVWWHADAAQADAHVNAACSCMLMQRCLQRPGWYEANPLGTRPTR